MLLFSFIVYFAFESCRGKFAEGWYINKLEELKGYDVTGRLILGFNLGIESDPGIQSWD